MIEIGKYNTLKIIEETPMGLRLSDNDGNEALLPRIHVTAEDFEKDEIEVFIYSHNEDIIATRYEPKITLNQFGYLQVKTVNQFGAFVEWGVEKKLLVPFREQTKEMVEDEFYMVVMYLDDDTNRLVGSAKIYEFLDNDDLTVAIGDEVDLVVIGKSDLGMNVIINHLHRGLIFNSELFENLSPGDKTKGYIKKISEDNKIDVVLRKEGYEGIEPISEKILTQLKAHNGFLSLTDKSEPEEISAQLGMSKKTFKKAIGLLYKQKIITLELNGIRLIER
ncbi:MAG: GntR family transcriptional regulator [Bacteroidetes bacterium]|nr:GntR family transcriptional regulator [Bacteroidota bacterium]